MADFVVYNPVNGQILRAGRCPENMVTIQAGLNELTLVGQGGDDKHYILNQIITIRPTMPIAVNKTIIVADGVDSAILTGIPENAVMTSRYGDNQITGGTVTLTNNVAETLTLKFVLFPYLDFDLALDYI